MKKLAALAAAFLAVLVAAPLTVAGFVVSTSPAVAHQVACVTAGTPTAGVWRPPLQQAYALTSPFGPRVDPITGAPRLHTGQDLVSLPGPGPVVAAAAGTVTVADDPHGYGHYVTIDHGADVATRYAHLAAVSPGIVTGAPVWAGEQVGVEGSTGHSTGNHLHFEVRVHGAAVDPVAFMREHGAPLDGLAVPPSAPPGAADPGGPHGGTGFDLPPAGTPRLASLTNPPLPIPAAIKTLYVGAAARYHLPWTLLAGIGMEETAHGAATATSTAGARGLMQFLPATWARYGVDGSGDGRADIDNNADSATSAANYLSASGATTGPSGVRRAVFAYNHAHWYVNDVLYYAAAYGAGIVPGDPHTCDPGGDATLPPIDGQSIHAVLTWARSHIGDPYVFGATGPHAWDCSSFTQAAYARIGVTLPRTASAQRDWLAAGNGVRVVPGHEQAGDLLFVDTYLGPNQIGHVMLVGDPNRHRTIEAGGTHVDTYDYTHWTSHHLFQIWRVGAPPGTPGLESPT